MMVLMDGDLFGWMEGKLTAEVVGGWRPTSRRNFAGARWRMCACSTGTSKRKLRRVRARVGDGVESESE